jgi:hypothetical protein
MAKEEVERAHAKDPAGFARKNAMMRLRMIADLAFRIIPGPPRLKTADRLG